MQLCSRLGGKILNNNRQFCVLLCSSLYFVFASSYRFLIKLDKDTCGIF